MHLELDVLTEYPGLRAKRWDILATTHLEKKLNDQTVSWHVSFTMGLWITLESLQSRGKPIHTLPVSLVFEQLLAPTRDQLFGKLMESNTKTTVNEDLKLKILKENNNATQEDLAAASYTEELNVFPLGDFATVGFQPPDAVLVCI